METTILTAFLKVLKVKYTKEFANKTFRTHPYKYSLYGLSDILSSYQIPNAGIRLEDKDITRLSPPFIAHVSNNFAVVSTVSEERVTYLWNNRTFTDDIQEFKKGWSGVVLLAEPQKESIEPDYQKHLKWQRMLNLQDYAIYGIVGVILCLFYSLFLINKNWGYTITFSLNLWGLGISYLLLLKQEKVQSAYADKICSLFHQKDCNDILESTAAKVGIFSWSEIGFSYFLSNILLMVLFSDLFPYAALINIIALPYTIWSVWYQRQIAKQWCVLCLNIQAALWGIFISNYFFGYIFLPTFTIIDIIIVGILYLLPILLVNKTVEIISNSNKLDTTIQELESFKNRSEVFTTILKQQSYYQANKETSSILFGNPNAKIGITILTNPHCEPCAKMHLRIEALLKDISDKVYVQYIFSSFTEELIISNKFLIAAYLETKDKGTFQQIYSNWFQKGKYDSKEYIQKFNFAIDSEAVEMELAKHTKWKDNNKLMATPTILINGYKLPEEYNIENIRYLTDIEIN